MKQNQKIIDLAKFLTNRPLLLIKDLTLFYSKYKNGDKITKLLIIWLTQYLFFYKTYYKSKNFKILIVSKRSLFLSADKITGNQYDIISLRKNIIFSFISLFIASLSKNLFLRG